MADIPKDQEIGFAPNFFNIPALVMLDPDLQPMDAKVYGVVFWLEQLKDGRCWASNSTLAKFVGSSPSGVANSLVRLREKGYIACLYDDKNQRKEIRTLVYYSVNPYSNEEGGVTQTSNIINKKKKNLSSETPKLTEEQERDIKKSYRVWLLYMVVDPEVRYRSENDAKLRVAALKAAEKKLRFTDKRKALLARRTEDLGGVRLRQAIVALSRSDFHRTGIRSDGEQGSFVATIEWLCGSYEKAETWANKYHEEEK